MQLDPSRYNWFMRDDLRELSELARIGWALQLVPVPSPLGVPMTLTLVWSLRRDILDDTLDGGDALPIIQHVSLTTLADDLPRAVHTIYARMFPLSAHGDIPDRER
jgi:hypothetical protein